MPRADAPRPAPPPEASDPPPRGLLLAAAGWVLLSLLIAYGLRPPILPLASTYAPAARLALITMLAGALIGWPLLRLSQRPAERPIRRTLLDLVVLVGALQVTLWPLRLAAAWPIGRTVAIDGWCVGWMLAAATCPILGGRLRSHAARTSMMAVLLAVLAGPPMLAPWLLPGRDTAAIASDPVAWASPFGGLARLAAPGRLDLLEIERTAALAALGAGVVLATTAAAIVSIVRDRR